MSCNVDGVIGTYSYMVAHGSGIEKHEEEPENDVRSRHDMTESHTPDNAMTLKDGSCHGQNLGPDEQIYSSYHRRLG